MTWPLPIYELALMTKRVAADSGVELRCTIVTPEAAPLVIFGPEASTAVTKLLSQRDIDVINGAYAGQGRTVGLSWCPASDSSSQAGLSPCPSRRVPG